jgi:membrane dipeptidase
MSQSQPPRLIDLHCDWLLQYAGETTVYDPALYADAAARLGQAEGYLQNTRAAVLSCWRSADDWARQPAPWAALAALVARIEAEFPGRVLADPDDHARWRDDPEGLCWAVIGVEGFDALVRTSADLEKLPRLFVRGVRVFQPAYTPGGVLAGSSAPGDDRGLTDLGRAFLQTLADLGSPSDGPRPVLDLAHLNPRSMSDVIAWFEADPSRLDRLIPVYSHGALRHDGFAAPRAITPENLGRLRTLGGYVGFSVGPPFYATAEALKAGLDAAASLPFLGRLGSEGIGIGTDFLGVDQTLPGMGDVAGLVAWLASTFDPVTASALIAGNATQLLARTTGAAR